MFAQVFARLWNEDAGVIVFARVAALGDLALLRSRDRMQVLRDATVQEVVDLGMAFGAINNSYVFTVLRFRRAAVSRARVLYGCVGCRRRTRTGLGQRPRRIAVGPGPDSRTLKTTPFERIARLKIVL